MAPLNKLFASPGVPIWLGPANYASYSSTITLTSKTIKQTIDNLFQFDLDKSYDYLWKDTFAPVVPRLKGQGFNATALRRPCLQLSAVTASLYLPRCLRSRVTCDKTPNIVKFVEGHGFLGPSGYVYVCRQRSGHEWTASSALHDTRTVKLALVQCECHTGKWTVIARIKSINWNWAADVKISRTF